MQDCRFIRDQASSLARLADSSEAGRVEVGGVSAVVGEYRRGCAFDASCSARTRHNPGVGVAIIYRMHRQWHPMIRLTRQRDLPDDAMAANSDSLEVE